ncbi:hypothetical protein [Candidatus Laterigemmans baculatus]|uniref:hypothetical protein n=1 Tax=Candidatus Laterigemmans baculatus TaxID=2770505 RepID=UPI00193BA065|nr:hypothetical protein [Candidatus Laterigemmans baculatus]
MTTKTKRLLIIASAAMCLLLGISTWGVVRIVAWASDLPNRVDIQVDGEAVTWFVTESARATLQQPDPEKQLEGLRALADGVKTNPEVVPWIQKELKSEIDMLRESPDAMVADVAEEVHASLSPPK